MRKCKWLIGAVLVVLSAIAPTTWAVSTTWDGTTGLWSNGAKWTAGTPNNGDTAVVNGGQVMLTSDSAILGSFTMGGGTLVFTNWDTRLIATNVVLNAGTVTLPDRFTSSQMSNRVYMVCSNDFTLNTNALIYVCEKGWQGGYGPGKSAPSGSVSGGAGYGGKGGFADPWSTAPGVAYGSTNAPLEPGSGAGTTPYAYGHDGVGGGGAVRIIANGTVTIHGTINANGGSHPIHGYNGAGSGGAIYITCGTFQGGTNGLLSVNGGNVNSSWAPSAGGGGGGRIAVNYTSVGASHGVRFSAASGWSWLSAAATFEENWFWAPDPGSVWVPNTALLSSTVTDRQFTGVRLYVGAGASWSVSSLTVKNASFAFADDGFQLTVTNTCRIDSSGALGIGTVSRGPNPVMTCGGLVLTNGGTLTVFSGKTNGIAQNYGARVSVSGDLVVAAASWVMPYSHSTDGGSVLFRTTNLIVAVGGGFNAHGRGYAQAQGPGKGSGGESSGGGAHGGRGGLGGWFANVGGTPYGVTNMPIGPGSGGGACPYAKGYGGGCIRIEAAATAAVNGSLQADGMSPLHYYCGAGAGGGIYLKCATFGGTTNGILSAKGGSLPNSLVGGAGGGGRIAVDYQNLASSHATRFSTAAGTGWSEGDVDNRWFMSAERGTLWLPNTNLLSTTLANRLFDEVRLAIPGFSSWAVSSLTVSNCSVFFLNPGLQLTVAGDLKVYKGKLGIDTLTCAGSINLTNAASLRVRNLDCEGDVRLTDASGLSSFSGKTNGIAQNYGSLVDVAGRVFVTSASWVYPYSHETDGGSPLFRLRTLMVTTNAGFNANDRGFGAGKGYGVGRAWNEQGGGSGYGGQGGAGPYHDPPTYTDLQKGGGTYGNSNAPVAPGSGTDCSYADTHGGGLVRIEASQGVTVHGTITANGGNPMHWYSGAGSGGGIFISCDSFAGNPGSILRAIGGTAGNPAALEGGGGGGGRIAILRRVTPGLRTKLINGQNPAGIVHLSTPFWFLGSVSVTNGQSWAQANPGTATWPDDYALPGTIAYLQGPALGTVVTIW